MRQPMFQETFIIGKNYCFWGTYKILTVLLNLDTRTT